MPIVRACPTSCIGCCPQRVDERELAPGLFAAGLEVHGDGSPFAHDVPPESSVGYIPTTIRKVHRKEMGAEWTARTALDAI